MTIILLLKILLSTTLFSFLGSMATVRNFNGWYEFFGFLIAVNVTALILTAIWGLSP